MEYNKLIAEMSLSDEVEGFYILKAAGVVHCKCSRKSPKNLLN